MNKVFGIVTDKIVKRIEEGNFKSWSDFYGSSVRNRPVNYMTGRPYGFLNSLLLSIECDGILEFITFNAVQKLAKENPDKGIKVRKGSKSYMVVSYYLWDTMKKQRQYDFDVLNHHDEDTDDEKGRYKWCFGYTPVFSISDVEGIEPRRSNSYRNDESVIDKDEACDKLIDSYLTNEGINLTRYDKGNYYSPTYDEINIANDKDFISTDMYYSTVFHEMVHSTGHKDRLGRELKGMFADKGSYGKEELIAELGSAFLSNEMRGEIEDVDDENAYYLDNWLKAIKEDPELLCRSALKAEKAVDYIKKGVEGKTDKAKRVAKQKAS